MSDDLINYSPPTSPFDSAHATVPTEIILASPWRRIVAVTINYAIAFVPLAIFTVFVMFILPSLRFDHDTAFLHWSIWDYYDEVAYTYLVIFGFIQVIMMTKTGQSIGKKIMGIKVIQADGGKASFVRIVLCREVLYQFLEGSPGFILLFLASEWRLWNQYGPSDIMMVLSTITLTTMLFFKKNQRRTLQDMLAKTLVIKV